MTAIAKMPDFAAAAAVAGLALALLAAPQRAAAQEYYLGQIVQGGNNFCRRGTVPADGQLLPIAQNTALFSLFGTIYGGDGRTTFGIPDLRGRVPLGQGQGPGLPNYVMGQRDGAETHVMTEAEMPGHSHAVNANNLDGDKPGPGGKLLAAAPPGGSGSETIYSDQPPTVTMSPAMIAPAGGSQPFGIQDPVLVTRFCVVSVGTYPSRP